MSTINPRADRLNSFLEPLVGLAVVATIPLVFLEAQLGEAAAQMANSVVWAVFTLRFLLVLFVCESREQRKIWLRRCRLDIVIIVVTFPMLPNSLASLRLLGFGNVVTLLRFLQMGRLLILGWFYQWLKAQFHHNPLLFTGTVSTVSILIGANLLHLVEPDTLPTLGSALWFTFTTCSTVGYGDIVPVSQAGQVLGVGLMIVGVATMAAFSGALASYLTSGRDHKLHRELEEVLAELKSLRLQLKDLESQRADLKGLSE